MENITKINCRLKTQNYINSGDIDDQAKAWNIVFDFCVENGMPQSTDSGIERVIGFLEKLLNEPSSAKRN